MSWRHLWTTTLWISSYQSEEDADDDEERGFDVCQKQERGDGDADQSQKQISIKFVSDDLKKIGIGIKFNLFLGLSRKNNIVNILFIRNLFKLWRLSCIKQCCVSKIGIELCKRNETTIFE